MRGCSVKVFITFISEIFNQDLLMLALLLGQMIGFRGEQFSVTINS